MKSAKRSWFHTTSKSIMPRLRVTSRAIIIFYMGIFAWILPELLAGEASLSNAVLLTEERPGFFDSLRGRIHGYAQSKSFYFFEKDDSRDKNLRTELKLKLEYLQPIAPGIRFFASPVLWLDNDDYADGIIKRLEDRDKRRESINADEFYLDIRGRDFDVRLGKQIFAWGQALIYNPTDNLSPWDYSDLLDYYKIGQFALDGKYYWKNLTFGAALIPTFTPSRLPRPDTHFSFTPSDFQYPINERDFPKTTIGNVQYALKVSATGIKGWDFSLSYYDGFNDITTPIIENNNTLTPTYTRIRVPGMDVSRMFGKMGVHAEIAQFISEGETADDYLHTILGINYKWTDLISTHNLGISLEYAREDVTHKGRAPNRFESSGLGRVFKNSVISRLTYELSDTARFTLFATANFMPSTNTYIQPKFEYSFIDNVWVEGGFDILNGRKSTFWGQFDDEDRSFLTVKYSF